MDAHTNVLDPHQILATMHGDEMMVLKRGTRGYEPMDKNKIRQRLNNMAFKKGLTPLKNVDIDVLTDITFNGSYNGISTEELDKISADCAALRKDQHPDYGWLAARIYVSNLHKTTNNTFSGAMEELYAAKPKSLSPAHISFIRANAAALNEMINHDNDYLYDANAMRTLIGTYLRSVQVPVNGPDGAPRYILKIGDSVKTFDHSQVVAVGLGKFVKENDSLFPVNVMTKCKVVDRPQYLLMRIAIALYMDVKNGLKLIKETYDDLSAHQYTHATPTLLNACKPEQQLGSCFLLGTKDNIDSIMENVKDCSLISAKSGGIGVHISNVRSRFSTIASSGGMACGVAKQLKFHDAITRCWDQGGSRPGAIAVFMEPWHGDIMEFLELRMQQGADELRTRNLYLAVVMNDLFMQRYEKNGQWSLFSESTAPGLSGLYDGMLVCSRCNHCDNPEYAKYFGDPFIRPNEPPCQHQERVRKDAFSELYMRYEHEGLATRIVSTSEIMHKICRSMQDNGTPYIMFKDHTNRQSNQANIGTIKSMNLCMEIAQISDFDSYASCTLASINLTHFVKNDHYDFEGLHRCAMKVCRNLNRVIDVNVYPVEKCIKNVKDYRPIGIGIQGLADVFIALKIPFISQRAQQIDIAISETIYHAALLESCNEAESDGPYAAFGQSPASHGKLRFDLWEENQMRFGKERILDKVRFSGMYDWDALKNKIQTHGLRNSLTTAYMPTESTMLLFGNCGAAFEPPFRLIYVRGSKKDAPSIICSNFVEHMISLGLWNERVRAIVSDTGSCASIEEIPADVREIYKNAFEIKQKDIITRSAMRSAFIDQSQSLNLHYSNNSANYLVSAMIYGWRTGLTTGSYYAKTPPAANAQSVNIAILMKRTEEQTKKQNVETANEIQPVFGQITNEILPEDKQTYDVCEIGCTSCSS